MMEVQCKVCSITIVRLPYLAVKVNDFNICYIFFVSDRFIDFLIGGDSGPDIMQCLVLRNAIEIGRVANFL